MEAKERAARKRIWLRMIRNWKRTKMNPDGSLKPVPLSLSIGPADDRWEHLTFLRWYYWGPVALWGKIDRTVFGTRSIDDPEEEELVPDPPYAVAELQREKRRARKRRIKASPQRKQGRAAARTRTR